MSILWNSLKDDVELLRINLEVITKLVYNMGKVLESNLETLKRIEKKMERIEEELKESQSIP